MTPEPTVLRRLGVLALAFALLTALALPIGSPRRAWATITIRATGNGNVASKGHEVWVTGFGKGLGASELTTKGRLDPGWEARGNELVSYQHQPATARWEGYVDRDFAITLLRHPWSGSAELAINARTFVYDLYAVKGSAIVLRPIDYLDATAWRISLPLLLQNLIWVAGLALIWAALGWNIAAHKSRSERASNKQSSKPSLSATLAFALPSLVIYGAAHLSAWPAAMSPDSVAEWQGALTGQVYETLIPVHMGLVWLLAKVWQSPAIIIIAQIIALSSVTAALLAELSQWGTPKWALWLVAVIFPLLPSNFLMAVSFWKDVAYAVGMILSVRYLLEIIRTDAQALHRWGVRLGFLGSLLLLDLFRLNGLLVAAPTALLTGLAFRRSGHFRFLATAGAGLLAVPLMLHFLVYPVVGVKPVPKHYQAGTAMHIIGAMVAKGVDFPAEHKAVLDSVMPVEIWARDYNCQTAVPLFWNRHLDQAALWNNIERLNRIAFQAIRRHPEVFGTHELCVTSMIWQILPGSFGAIAVPVIAVWRDETWPTGPVLAPKLPGLTKIVTKLQDYSWRPEFVWIVWRPAIYLYLLLFIASALAVVYRNVRYLCLSLPGILNAISLVPTIGSPDFRYQYGIVATVPLLFPLLFTRWIPLPASMKLSPDSVAKSEPVEIRVSNSQCTSAG